MTRTLPIRQLYARVRVDMAVVFERRLRDVEYMRRMRAIGMKPYRIHKTIKRLHGREWRRIIQKEIEAMVKDMEYRPV